MDYQFYEQNNPYQKPVRDKRSNAMATAAIILGTISLAMCSCLYLSIVCGGMAILFALLSKGGETTMSQSAKIGLILGCVGLAATVVMYTITFVTIIHTYGSLEEYLRVYLKDYGMTLEELMEGLY